MGLNRFEQIPVQCLKHLSYELAGFKSRSVLISHEAALVLRNRSVLMIPAMEYLARTFIVTEVWGWKPEFF